MANVARKTKPPTKKEFLIKHPNGDYASYLKGWHAGGVKK